MSAPAPRAPVLDVIADAVAGGTSVSLVGLPGSGRSTLLAQVRIAAEDDGRHVVSVPGRSAGGDRPLESLALAGLAPGPTGTKSSLAAAVDALDRSVPAGRTLLVLDDVDAMDDASAAAVATVVARRDAAVVATLRPPFPGSRSVDRVLAGRDATVLRVPVLAFEDVHRMATEALGGDVDSDVAGRVYALSGGLPGVARSIVLEARRAGHLVEGAGRWVARQDLWTPALEVAVGRLTAGLGDDALDGLRILSVLGPAEVGTVRRLVPWRVVVALDDHGLVRLVEEEDRSLVVLFPPLLSEHLRHTGHGARGLEAMEAIGAALGAGDDDPDLPPRRPSLGPPLRWSSSPESAAILGRILRERAATQLLVRRDAWRRDPTSRNTVLYLDALLTDGASPEQIQAVLDEGRRQEASEPWRYVAFVRAWEVGYRALVLHDPESALSELPDLAARDEGREGLLFDAIAEHVRLVVDVPGPHEASAATGARPSGREDRPADRPDVDARRPEDDGLGRARGGILTQVGDVVRLVRGEQLLAQGHVVDAWHTFADVTLPATSPRQDAASLVPQAQMLSGEVVAATDRSARLLDEARGTLEQDMIEPHGYVVALGLFLQGRFTSLRDHLTSIFAISAPAPLRPTTRAGLLTLAAAQSFLEGNLQSARSLVSQLESMRLVGAFTPLARPAVARAVLALASGVGPREATRAAWDDVASLLARGHVLAAAFDGALLVDLWPDRDRAPRLAALALDAQGTVLPALGRYLAAAAERDAGALLRSVDDLNGRDLVVYATRAHTAAIRLLREDGQSARATAESARLRATAAQRGDELGLLVATFDTSPLTPREAEVARLVAQGLSNREVAERLVVSERTVDNHVYRIFRKLGVGARDDVARFL
ncbi:helix-turn-helix transcriptional regulator [Oerskovia jenensis]|uniref:helix-turn-helix transcriptional regulator n=1 Tax=Oerskovia jenensis TaxID=162169 RepID=UPI0036DE9CD9